MRHNKWKFGYAIDGEVTCIHITRRDGSLHEVIIDTEDLQSLFGWSMSVKVHGNTFCARLSQGYGTDKLLHRVIMNCDDPMVYVDHINGNGLDNRKVNLRLCSNAENQQNRAGAAANSKSGVRGVSLDKGGKWRADCRVNGVSNYLGLFDTVALAAEAVAKFREGAAPFSKEALNAPQA